MIDYIVQLDKPINEENLIIIDYNIYVKDLTLENEVKLTKHCVQTNFELGYCNTIFCEQGLTIEEDQNIYDIEKMNINEIYTAISRCKDISKVHFNYTDKVFKNYAYVDQIKIEMKSNILEDNRYKNGKIYKILLKEETRKQQLIYAGQTINTIEKRLSEHINDRFNLNYQFHQFLRSLGKERLEKISIELVEEYPCKSNMELLQREAYWIQKLNPEYNTYMRFVPKQVEEYEIKEKVIREDKDLIKISVIEDKKYILVYGKLCDKFIKTQVRFGARKTQKQAYDKAIDMKQQFINEYLTNGTISAKKSKKKSEN